MNEWIKYTSGHWSFLGSTPRNLNPQQSVVSKESKLIDANGIIWPNPDPEDCSELKWSLGSARPDPAVHLRAGKNF